MVRFLNLLLCLAIVIGLFKWVPQQSKLSRLSSEHQRLTKLYGDLEIDDPRKMYVRAIQTDEEMDFMWRVYVPQGLNLRNQVEFGQNRHSAATSSKTIAGRVSLANSTSSR